MSFLCCSSLLPRAKRDLVWPCSLNVAFNGFYTYFSFNRSSSPTAFILCVFLKYNVIRFTFYLLSFPIVSGINNVAWTSFPWQTDKKCTIEYSQCWLSLMKSFLLLLYNIWMFNTAFQVVQWNILFTQRITKYKMCSFFMKVRPENHQGFMLKLGVEEKRRKTKQ